MFQIGSEPPASGRTGIDRTNAFIAASIALLTGIVYLLTVQPSLSFWDCGEFIACSYILGIPHPPGSPLFIMIGRLFSVIPFAEDIAYNVNILSVISSAFTAMFGYLVTVRIVNLWYKDSERSNLTRIIAYTGGVTGALFLAFSRTNWANSVEAEVYGLTLLMSMLVLWYTLKFFSERGSGRSVRYMLLAVYLGVLGIGVHMAVFLVIPVAAIFFSLKKEASSRDWVYLCSFVVAELVLITLMSYGGMSGGYNLFLVVSAILFIFLAVKLYRSINVPWIIALGAISMIMIGFWKFIIALVIAAVLIAFYGMTVKKSSWRSGLLILGVALLGFSVNGFIPVRSSVNPRIDENNPSKGMTTLANFDMTTFVNFLERKQYGSMSMTERMFKRRGFFENQFGRHHNMGFWSYFEEQYSPGRVVFIPFFLLGALGVYFTMRKRLDVGYPFLVLLLVSSVGLILYMNFADGMKYDVTTGDAYLEVRNRDYFFTSAFVFFGLAIGLGVSALMEIIRTSVSKESQAGAVKSSMAFGLLALVPFQSNYFVSDRSGNYIPYDYAHNILESCPENAILFTSGDNDTFPLWCVQEVHRLRRDVRVVNLSLLNTDWYVAQMKNRFDVPMDLSDSQIVIEFYKSGGRTIARPPLAFNDRARRRQAYLVAQPFNGGVLRVQDMMVDEIVLASKFITPVAFTSEPYAESPLGLRKLKETHGVVHELKRSPLKRQNDVDHSYDLFMNKFQFRGLNQTSIWRDDNSTGVMISVGFGGLKVFNEYVIMIAFARQISSMESLKTTPGWDDNMQAKLDTLNQEMNGHNPADTAIFGERAMNIADRMIDVYPEFWMSYIVAAEYLRKEGDSATAMDYLFKGEETLQDFLDSSPENVNYRQDLGLIKHEIVRILGDADDQNREETALKMLWDGFKSNPNSGMAYQKLLQYLYERRRNAELVEATRMHAKYKVNLSNANVKQILGQFPELNQ